MTQLDDAERLTLFIGECWHEGHTGSMFCDHCGMIVSDAHRTFFLPNDWADLGAVRNKLVETGRWDAFNDFADEKWGKEAGTGFLQSHFNAWLFTPPTFNRLASEFLKGEKG